MPLRPLDVIDEERKIVARLHWSPPGIVTVETDNPDVKAFLEELIQRYTPTGIPSLSGRILKIDGHTNYETIGITLTIDDPDFVIGIAERLRDELFHGQRLYGFIRKQREILDADQELSQLLPLQPLEIMSSENNVVARLHWSPPGIVTVESENPDVKMFLEDLIQRYASTGIPSLSVSIRNVDGHLVYRTTEITVTIDNPYFVNEFAVHLKKEHLHGQMFYSRIDRQQETPPPDQGSGSQK